MDSPHWNRELADVPMNWTFIGTVGTADLYLFSMGCLHLAIQYGPNLDQWRHITETGNPWIAKIKNRRMHMDVVEMRLRLEGLL